MAVWESTNEYGILYELVFVWELYEVEAEGDAPDVW